MSGLTSAAPKQTTRISQADSWSLVLSWQPHGMRLQLGATTLRREGRACIMWRIPVLRASEVAPVQ